MQNDNEVISIVKTGRQSNIELLRIFAMLIIIGSHYVRYGVMAVSTDAAREIWQQGSSVNKVLSCLFLPGGAVGVAAFFLISGYFSCEKEGFSPLRGIKKVVLECLFYGVVLTGIFLILYAFGYRPVDVPGLTRICHMILASIFVPATSGLWWFITTWVFLMLLSPLLNRVVARDRRTFTVFLVLYLFLCVTIDTALVAPYYNLERAVFFYLAGAYIKKYANLERVKRFRPLHGVLFGICWVISAACQSPDFPYIDVSPLKKGLIDWGGGVLGSLILMPITVISLFLFFLSLDMGVRKWINGIAAGTLGVYLIHENAFFRLLIWHVLLKADTLQYRSKWFAPLALGSICLVFVVCDALDFLRRRLFEKRYIQIADKVIGRVFIVPSGRSC